jgi:hypothetical protein
VINSYYD